MENYKTHVCTLLVACATNTERDGSTHTHRRVPTKLPEFRFDIRKCHSRLRRHCACTTTVNSYPHIEYNKSPVTLNTFIWIRTPASRCTNFTRNSSTIRIRLTQQFSSRVSSVDEAKHLFTSSGCSATRTTHSSIAGMNLPRAFRKMEKASEVASLPTGENCVRGCSHCFYRSVEPWISAWLVISHKQQV